MHKTMSGFKKIHNASFVGQDQTFYSLGRASGAGMRGHVGKAEKWFDQILFKIKTMIGCKKIDDASFVGQDQTFRQGPTFDRLLNRAPSLRDF